MYYWQESPLMYRQELRAQKVAAQTAETLSISERRRLLVEAVCAFREYRKNLVYDKDVLTLMKEQGSIPFDVWMNAVLYGPDGYYTSGRCKINDGDFFTAVGDRTHVAAFYAAMQDHLISQGVADSDEVSILSVAPGGGDFERHFSGMHRYLQQTDPELSLPQHTKLYSIDISEANLHNQREKSEGRFSLENLSYPYFPKQDRIEFCMKDELHEGPLFFIPIEVLKEVCTLYDCAGTILTESEYREYYVRYILPYLQSKIDVPTYNFLCEHPEYMIHLAPFFQQSLDIPVAGSGFDLPFKNASLDIIFSNEFHDAQPSKVFIFNPEINDFEELYVSYDADISKFVLAVRPVDPLIRPILNLKLAYVDAQNPATGAGCLPSMQISQKPKEYLAVNMFSVLYLIEAARALKKGGLLLEGDYAQVGEYTGKVTHGLEKIRMPGGGGYFGSLDTIGEYAPPWRDVTVDYNPGFSDWLAPILGFQPAVVEPQDDFTLRRVGQLVRSFGESFEVIAFVKK